MGAFKPAVTGLDEPTSEWPPDHALLAAAAGNRQAPEDVAPFRFGPPVSPHLAASLASTRISAKVLVEHARATAEGAELLVCEGVGGLVVPLDTGYSVSDLATELGLPVVVVARPGLGTINHTLLTVEAARARGLTVAGVVFTPWTASPSRVEQSNRSTIELLADVPVATLRTIAPGDLAAAGAELPLDAWLASGG